MFYSAADVHVCRLLGEALFHADHTDRDLIDHRDPDRVTAARLPTAGSTARASGFPSASQHAVRTGSWWSPRGYRRWWVVR